MMDAHTLAWTAHAKHAVERVRLESLVEGYRGWSKGKRLRPVPLPV
jgi:hypothetical protein